MTEKYEYERRLVEKVAASKGNCKESLREIEDILNRAASENDAEKIRYVIDMMKKKFQLVFLGDREINESTKEEGRRNGEWLH